MKSLEVLARLHACLWTTTSLPREEFEAVNQQAVRHIGRGALVVSCQRVEAYGLEPCACSAPVHKTGIDALLHLATVASGLDSVVLGEEQIVGQVRAALAEAPHRLRVLGDVALAAARELRRELSFGAHSGYLLDQGLGVCGIRDFYSVLIIGTGHVGRLVAQRAREIGFGEIVLAGRTRPESEWFREGPFSFIPLAELRESAPVDVAVGCLGSNAAELDVAAALPPVRHLILDLGTPRNFAGACGARVLTIADLTKPELEPESCTERREVASARLRFLIERRLAMLAEDSQGSHVGALRHSIERLRQQELERNRRLHPEIPPETLDAITRALVNRLFHAPCEQLKEIDDAELRRRVVSLFVDHADLPAGVS
jgi:glutamyl-tRNA reductase